MQMYDYCMFWMLQYFPVSPREKFWLRNGQLVLQGAEQTPGGVCLGGGSGLLRLLRLRSGEGLTLAPHPPG